jgi:Kef-type K+ transport system membrane component KefB
MDGIGFGFLVPIFFITTGLHFDLHTLTSSNLALFQLPMFLLLFFIVRGLPALLIPHRELDIKSRLALGFLSATELPLVIAIVTIGVESGRLRPETAASLVGAGMVSVLLFPITALSLRRSTAIKREPVSDVAEPATLAESLPTASGAR